MKVSDKLGEFGFRALIKYPKKSSGWFLTDSFYFSLEDVKKDYQTEVHWPVESIDKDLVYVPTKEEYE